MPFNLQGIHELFTAGFAEVEARRRWEEEYKEEHGLVEERELTPYERMLKAGLFDKPKERKSKGIKK